MLLSLNVMQFRRLLVFNLESFYLMVQIVVLGIHTHPSLPWDPDVHGLSWELPAPWFIERQPLAHRKAITDSKGGRKGRSDISVLLPTG